LAFRRFRTFTLTRDLTLLFLINLIMSLGMNLTDSLRPLYIQSLGASVLQVSFLISITGLAGTLLRVPSGLISDRYGRRKIIVISIALAVFPPLLYTFSAHWEHLIPWGIVYAIAFALYMPSRMAIVADYTPVASRIRVYSIMNLAFPLGSLISPTLAGVLENAYGWNAVFYVATVLHGVGLVPGLFLPPPPKHKADEQPASSLDDVAIDLAFVRSLLPFFLLNLLIGLGMGTVGSITPIYLTDRFKVSTAEVGLFLSVGFGLTTILTQVPAGIVADKFGRRRFITTCLGVMPLFFLLWNVVDNFFLLLPIQMAINGLWSMTWPAFISLLMEHVPRSRRGVSSGLTQTGLMLGFTVGPVIGGYLWETLGTAFPYYASAVFFAFCIPILHFLRERGNTKG